MLRSFLYLIILFSFIEVHDTYAQKIFNTREGTAIFTSKYDDTSLSAKSDELLIQLNYENAKLRMILAVNSVRTGIDSLDKLFSSDIDKIYFDGKLGIDLITTSKHLTQYFNFSGYLIFKKISVLLTGKGEILHISDNSNVVACMLRLNFQIDPKKLKWNLKNYGIDGNIHAEVIQALLKKN